MSKEIYISSTPHETRLAIVENDNLTEIYYERENEYTLAGSIYNGKVTRVLPGMQSSFVDIGLDRDAFLYITDFMEEAGDAADFEGAAAEPRRGGRDGAREQGRERDQNREPRAAREPQPRPAEPSDADLFAEAVSSLDPARPASSDSPRGERSDRGDRDRNRRGGRNRRDRGGVNSESGNRREGERSASPERSAAPVERPAPPADMVSAVDLSAVSSTEGVQELGEGAPGADGSRRWRGRRGRRGGRPGEGSREAGQPGIAGADRGAQPLTPPTDLESEGAAFLRRAGRHLDSARRRRGARAPQRTTRTPRRSAAPCPARLCPLCQPLPGRRNALRHRERSCRGTAGRAHDPPRRVALEIPSWRHHTRTDGLCLAQRSLAGQQLRCFRLGRRHGPARRNHTPARSPP